jgi:hypothetical protein
MTCKYKLKHYQDKLSRIYQKSLIISSYYTFKKAVDSMWKARPVQASEQASLQWVEHMIVPTIINKQRGAQERSKGRVSRVFVHKRFP